MPVPARFKHLDTQRRNINRDTAPFQVINHTATSANEPVIASMRNKYVRYTPFTLMNTLDILRDENLSWPIGAEVRIMNVSTFRIGLSPQTGVTLNPGAPAGPYPRINNQWDQVILKKVGHNEWDVYGDI